MDKDKNKGLTDNGEGEFILNESGTSVTIDEDFGEDKDQVDSGEQANDAGDEEVKDTEKK